MHGTNENGQVFLVDSSVWIDYFRSTRNSPTDRLNTLFGNQSVVLFWFTLLAQVTVGYAFADNSRPVESTGEHDEAQRSTTGYRKALKARFGTVARPVTGVECGSAPSDSFL